MEYSRTEPLISIEKTPHYWVLRQKRCIDSRNEIALSSLGYFMRIHKMMQGFFTPAAPVVETVVPNPKLKLLDQIREVMRLNHYSIRTESDYCGWIRRFIRIGFDTPKLASAWIGGKMTDGE